MCFSDLASSTKPQFTRTLLGLREHHPSPPAAVNHHRTLTPTCCSFPQPIANEAKTSTYVGAVDLSAVARGKDGTNQPEATTEISVRVITWRMLQGGRGDFSVEDHQKEHGEELVKNFNAGAFPSALCNGDVWD
jgi:hypothetical protein